MILDNALFKTICGIYCWQRNGKALYIGQSTHIITRIVRHPVINVVEPVLDTDTIEIYECPPHGLYALEQRLIEQYKPKYNNIRTGFNNGVKKQPVPKTHMRGRTEEEWKRLMLEEDE